LQEVTIMLPSFGSHWRPWTMENPTTQPTMPTWPWLLIATGIKLPA